MSYEWHYDLSTDRPEAIEAFGDLYTAYALQGQPISSSPICEVVRIELDGVGYFIKRYKRGCESIWNCWGASKARREWTNLLRFAQWELPVARVVAWGEESLLGVAGHGMVITEEISNSSELLPQLKLDNTSKCLDSISLQLADLLSKLHSYNFSFGSVESRNIVVSGTGSEVKITLLGYGNTQPIWKKLSQTSKVKNLAELNNITSQFLSKTLRLRFYLSYVKQTTLLATDKVVIRQLLSLFNK